MILFLVISCNKEANWAYSENQYLLPKTYEKDGDWHDQWLKVECDFRNTMAKSPQSWDWLENKRSKYNKIFRKM